MQPRPRRGGYFVQPQEGNEWKSWAEPGSFPFSHSSSIQPSSDREIRMGKKNPRKMYF